MHREPGILNKALGALSEANASLEHVLDHIDFVKTQGTKRLVSDDCCRDLVPHKLEPSGRTQRNPLEL